MATSDARTGIGSDTAARPDIARSTVRLVVVVLLPAALLGLVLALSLFGAIFGVPLLLISVPPFLAVRRVRREGSVAARRAARSLAVFSIGLTIVLGAAAVTGLDDLESATDLLLVAIGGLWVGASWLGTAHLRRLTPTRVR